MDYKYYINMLKTQLHPSAEKLGLNKNYIFMQHNNPKHTAWNTRMWLLYKTVQNFSTGFEYKSNRTSMGLFKQKDQINTHF